MWTPGPVVVAGPCVLEDDALNLRVARELRLISGELGLPVVFKASFDKANRSRLDAPRGPGLDAGLRLLSRVKEETGLPVLTDVHEPWQAAQAAATRWINRKQMSDIRFQMSENNEKTTIKVKSLFFDRAGVMSKGDVATRRVLSRFGAFVRTTAKHSIRKKNGPSAPGTPPNSHVGLLRKFIFFSYEPTAKNVVIGPTLLSRKKSGGNTIPEVLEYGGNSERMSWDDTEKQRKSKKVTIRQRPFMHPAFNKELPKLPAMWRNSVK